MAVLIITYRRPEYLDSCLAHLERQALAPTQVVVVDGSPDDLSERVAERHPIATYVRNPAGAGNMTSSRNAGLPLIQAEVIAFLDDDSNAGPSYIAELVAFCATHPEVSIGCCRATNGVPGEDSAGRDQIGTLAANGSMTGNFAAEPGLDVPIDHGLGATMWIRRSLMDELRGFREYFPGTSACEDTDLFLRARRLGHQAWFVHAAVANHVAAPQEGGQRFDRRYTYWTAHNRAILFAADGGILHRRFWSTFVADIARNLSYGAGIHRRVARTAIVTFAWLRGSVYSIRLFGFGPQPAVGGYRREQAE